MAEVKLNPYSQAMLNCLVQLRDFEDRDHLDETTSQFLANMIQGRFLQYLITMICESNDIVGKELEKKLGMVLMSILSDKFFAVFREKVRKRPEIVFMIAKRITTIESTYLGNKSRIDALFRGISRHYFEYQNFQIIIRWITSNPDVEKLIFLSKARKAISDPALIKTLEFIIQNDKYGIIPAVFNRYLVKGKIDRLSDLIRTGDWKIEAAYVKEKYSGIINWRHYIERL